MFTSFVDSFRSRTLNPAIATKMNEAGAAWVAEAQRLVHVRTGQTRAGIGYTYDAATKTLKLYCDHPAAMFEELGTRYMKAIPFMRPALSVVPRIWRGSIGNALTGHSTEIQAANVAPKYHDRINKFTKGKIGGARLKLGHGRFR